MELPKNAYHRTGSLARMKFAPVALLILVACSDNPPGPKVGKPADGAVEPPTQGGAGGSGGAGGRDRKSVV